MEVNGLAQRPSAHPTLSKRLVSASHSFTRLLNKYWLSTVSSRYHSRCWQSQVPTLLWGWGEEGGPEWGIGNKQMKMVLVAGIHYSRIKNGGV